MSFAGGGGTRRAWRRFRGAVAPSATYVLVSVTLLVFLLQLVPNLGVTEALLYSPIYSLPGAFEPWRVVTVAFVHSTSWILHIAFNMIALWLFGQQLETMLGKWRFLALYLLSTVGGSAFVLLWAFVSGSGGAVVGASGAIFGLFGAFFVLARKQGANVTGLVVMIALNLAIGFLVPNVSWQAHVGGLIAGGLVSLIIVQTRRREQRRLQWLLLAALAVLLLLACYWPVLLG